MNPLRGIGLKLLAVVIFIVMQTLIKATSDTIPPGEAVFFRSFFALPVIFIWLGFSHGLGTGLRVKEPLGHVWRAFVGILSMGLAFAALGFLPLPEAVALSYATPLLTVVFAAMFLGEEVRAFRMICVGLGFAGVLIVLSPRLSIGAEEVSPAAALGVMMALTSAVFGALAQVTVRKLVNTETTSAIVFWFSALGALFSLVTIPFGWVMPTLTDAAMLIAAGLAGGLAQVFLTASYRYADASLIAPFDYASMLFAVLIGWLVFGDFPTVTVIAGSSLIVVAGMLIIWRERRLGLERSRQRRSMSNQN